MQQAQMVAAADRCICLGRLRQGQIGVEIFPRLHLGVARGDAVEAGGDQFS
jgi:hypothetical protein